MTRAEPLDQQSHSTESTTPADAEQQSELRSAVTRAVSAYLDELDGQISTDVYQMVLAEIEAPLLEQIMAYTRNNQTKASIMLGLNRGTLRKKLKQYNLISAKGQG